MSFGNNLNFMIKTIILWDEFLINNNLMQKQMD